MEILNMFFNIFNSPTAVHLYANIDDGRSISQNVVINCLWYILANDVINLLLID